MGGASQIWKSYHKAESTLNTNHYFNCWLNFEEKPRDVTKNSKFIHVLNI